MKESISEWDSIVHKNVRASVGEPVGNIVAISGDSIQVETAGSRGQFLIPKSHVATFNGAEVTLDASTGQLEEFRRP